MPADSAWKKGKRTSATQQNESPSLPQEYIEERKTESEHFERIRMEQHICYTITNVILNNFNTIKLYLLTFINNWVFDSYRE